jgi:hypothetical protein
MADEGVPFDELAEEDRQALFDNIFEGNSKDDLVVMYLETLTAEELQAMLSEWRQLVEEADREGG